jgi:hypothetical protein
MLIRVDLPTLGRPITDTNPVWKVGSVINNPLNCSGYQNFRIY